MRLLLLTLTVSAFVATALPAQDAPIGAAPGAPPSPSAVRWEYGIFSHWLGGAKRWSVPGATFVEEDNLNRFLTALGATPDEHVHKYASEERYNATVLQLLGRQGWELVNCQYVERSRTSLYLCYLKRPAPVDRAKVPSAGDAPIMRP